MDDSTVGFIQTLILAVILVVLFVGLDGIEKQLKRIADYIRGEDGEDDGDDKKFLERIPRSGEAKRTRNEKVVEISRHSKYTPSDTQPLEEPYEHENPNEHGYGPGV